MPENEHKSDDFISIDSIKNIFLDFFRFVFRTIDFILISIQRKLGLFLFCCALGLVSGYIYYWQNPRYYHAEMIVQSNTLSKKTYNEIVQNLNDLIGSQSYGALSSQLKIDHDKARDILSIMAVTISNVSLNSDTSTKVSDAFKIQLKARSTSSIPIFQDALLKYFKNSPYLRLIKEGEKRIYEEKLAFINLEQRKLDSLVSTYNMAVSQMKMPTTFYNNAMDPAGLYQYALKLDSVKERTQKWLNNESEAILLIDGFKTPANPQSVSLMLSLLIGFLFGVLLGILLVILSVLRNAKR